MKYIIPVLAIAALSITGCKKEQANKIEQRGVGVSELNEAFYPLGNIGKVDGSFSMTAYNTLASQNNMDYGAVFTGNTDDGCLGIMQGAAYDEHGVWHATFEKKDCKSFSVNKDLFDVWGREIVFTGSGALFENTMSVGIYMPTEVKITSPAYAHGLMLGSGYTITWNKDEKNPTHDVIELTYDPEDYGNEQYKAQGYNNTVTRRYLVHNSLGSYTFTAADFSNIPSGALINVSVQRYNGKVYTQPGTGARYALYAGSQVDASFTAQ